MVRNVRRVALIACIIGAAVAVPHLRHPTVRVARILHTTQAMLPRPLMPPLGLHWRSPSASPHLEVATGDGGNTTWMWMDTRYLRFRFLPGYTWPERSPRTKADHNPVTWVPAMVAGFNGGYKLADHVGGYYYLGHTIAPLRAGYASMVFYRDGSLRVGVWDRDVRMTPDIVAVRQNLRPLVLSGRVQTRPTDTQSTWGYNMVHGWWIANRSALGMRPDGSLVFVYGHHRTPAQLAASLVRAGATTGIALDMNGWWPTGYVYAHYRSHIVGSKINLHIERPPTVYLDTYSKDFVAVLTTGA